MVRCTAASLAGECASPVNGSSASAQMRSRKRLQPLTALVLQAAAIIYSGHGLPAVWQESMQEE